tara:strand:- start:2110 stop:2313 length:204 start_codon:yes stop_codon:yes gene_type:complete
MGKQRVKFTFEEELVKQPVIYELGRKFEIVTNIRRADVGEEVGGWSWNWTAKKQRSSVGWNGSVPRA